MNYLYLTLSHRLCSLSPSFFCCSSRFKFTHSFKWLLHEVQYCTLDEEVDSRMYILTEEEEEKSTFVLTIIYQIPKLRKKWSRMSAAL